MVVVNAVIVLLYVVASEMVNQNLSIDSSVTTIICGDSHTKTAICDSIMPASVNISIASQSYYYTFETLKRLIFVNPHIDKVILGYSFHSIANRLDRNNFETVTSSRRCNYMLVSDSRHVYELVLNNYLNTAIDVLYTSMYHITSLIMKKPVVSMMCIGEYYPMNTNILTLENIRGSIQNHYYRNGKLQSVGYDQIQYLTKIDSLCNVNEIQLYLINTPISEEYRKRIPKRFIFLYYKIVTLTNAILLDYNDLDIPVTSYANADHLNVFGAREFTQIIWQVIEHESKE